MLVRAGQESLASLLKYLDGLAARVPVDELQARLAALDVCIEDVSDFVRFSNDQYRRNLVREGPFYHALVICWRSGQRSPIHNHAGSTCGLRVLTGVATETIFEPGPCSLLKAASSRDLSSGQVAASQDSDTHQVSNLQNPGTDLVTLHIYSPPLLRMDTFSLTDSTVGEFRPMIFSQSDGSGI
ncbi:MAG: cysteine dioxygenase [Planctomycetota bacterium]|jgi:cysteine dioxygenase